MSNSIEVTLTPFDTGSSNIITIPKEVVSENLLREVVDFHDVETGTVSCLVVKENERGNYRFEGWNMVLARKKYKTGDVLRFWCGDLVVSMDLSKDFGASRSLLLDKESYGHWKVKMRAVIIGIGMDAWSAVTDGWSAPTVKDDKGEDILKPIVQWTDAEKTKASANSKALTLIFSSIIEHQFKRIKNCESAKDA